MPLGMMGTLGSLGGGAATGAAGGPIGMIAGALAGAGTEALATNEEEKARRRAEDRPKRRRLAKFQQIVGQAMNNRQRALIAMAQVHQNFASMW